MIYGSVCSGIEAATTAWHPLGWTPAFFAEIEKFPSSILKHQHANTPNLGDMTKFKDWPDYAIDILVGGTPCQSFSVAGLRKGLADPRGNLMLTYLAIAARYRPEWLVWENVPGVLSSNGGKDFGTFLGGLGELGYGFAYRVLDAQHVRVQSHPRAVPQRRRRVFVVGHLRDWRRAAAVLFERQSLCGNPAPRRQARKGVAATLSSRTKGGGGLGTDFELDGGIISQGYSREVAATINAAYGSKLGLDNQHIDSGAGLFVAHSLRGEGFDAGEDVASGPDGIGIRTDGAAYTIEARAEVQAVAYRTAANCGPFEQDDKCAALNTATDPNQNILLQHSAVRRLTPRECERLQGFPDDYTKISEKTADGPRYKALGNSMAVNVMRWIGERIQQVDAITHKEEA